MSELRLPRAVVRALILVGVAALLSACQVDTSVDVTVGGNGAGQVQVNAGFDDEALARAGDLKLDDVRAAGWTVTGPQKEPERDATGRTWVHASKAFADADQFTAIMNEVNGPNGIFRDFKLSRTTSFAKVTYTMTGTIDPQRGLDAFSDPEVAQLLGGNALGQPTAELAKQAPNLSLVLNVLLPHNVAGSADKVSGRRAQWTVALDRKPINVDVHSAAVQGAARRWAAIAAALGLGALFLAVIAILRRPQRRLDAHVPAMVLPALKTATRSVPPLALPSSTAPAPPVPAPLDPAPEPARVAPLVAPVAPDAAATRRANQKRIQVVVLDAMGVLFRDPDDVQALLIPFVRERGGIDDPLAIRARYVDASLGHHTTAELWPLLGLADAAADLDRTYVERFVLNDAVHEFLDAMDQRGIMVACLSNDVSEWSALLRERFALDERIAPWIVSGEVGVRKPDDRIFAALQQQLDVPLRACLFVDDRLENLAAAKKLGMATVHFAREPVDGSPFRRVGSLFELFSRGRVTT